MLDSIIKKKLTMESVCFVLKSDLEKISLIPKANIELKEEILDKIRNRKIRTVTGCDFKSVQKGFKFRYGTMNGILHEINNSERISNSIVLITHSEIKEDA